MHGGEEEMSTWKPFMLVTPCVADAPCSVLLCKQPALHGTEPAVPRALPHAAGIRGGSPGNGTLGCKSPLMRAFRFLRNLHF